MLGLKSRLNTFSVQRKINQSQPEPLMAILPGVSLSQLWQSMAMMKNTLLGISWLILSAALLGSGATLLASMRERQQELAILRTLGARPWFVFALIQAETLLLTGAQDLISSHLGISIDPDFLTPEVIKTLAIIVVASQLVSLYPGYQAYRLSLR